MGSNANILVAARLDGDTINAATGSASSYTPSGGFNYLAGKRRNGVHFDLTGTTDGDEVLYPLTAFDLADHACVLMHCVVTPQTDLIDTNSTQYYFMQLGDGYDNQKVYVAHSDTYDGLEMVARESVLTRLTFTDLDMLEGESYSLAILIKNDPTHDNLMMSLWMNGRMLRGLEVPTTSFTTDIDQLYIGNAFSSHARPAESVIEDVLLAVSDDPDAYDGDTIWKLHSQGLDLACVDDPTIYENQKTVVGYTRETPGDGVVPRWYDEATGRMWGYTTADRDQLHYSDDEGENWSLFHDFNNGAVIRGIWIWGSNVYVSYAGTIQRSSKTSASFSEVLSLADTDSYILNWGVAFSPDGTTMAVCEYEPQSATNSNRVLTTETGNSGEWTTRKTVTGSEEHWHSVDYLADGTLVAAVGDTDSRVYTSTDHGANWSTLIEAGSAPFSEEQVISAIELADGRVLLGSDKTTSRALLAQWEPDGDGHGWTLVNEDWSRIAPVVGDRLANVFAIHQAGNGTIWFHAHAESQAGRDSSIWLMHPDSRAPVLVEDLGEVTWADLNAYVETPNYIWADVYRWPRNARISGVNEQQSGTTAGDSFSVAFTPDYSPVEARP